MKKFICKKYAITETAYLNGSYVQNTPEGDYMKYSLGDFQGFITQVPPGYNFEVICAKTPVKQG